MNIRIETPRLIIRELLPEDAMQMFEMDSDPEVHKYLGNKPLTDIEEVHKVIVFVRQQYADNGIGRWAVTLKDTGEFIGWTGFKRFTETVNNHINHLDFGYRHMRRHWGQGYAYEAAKASLDYGIDTLGFKDIYAMTDVDNLGSRHLLEKLGFEYKKTFAYDGPSAEFNGLPVTWYELTERK